MAPRQHDRRAAHGAVELEEGDDRAREGNRTDGDAQSHFDPADRIDEAVCANDPERLGVEVGGPADQHRRQPDEAVKRGNQLRHRGHRDAPRGNYSDRSTKADGSEDLGEHPQVGGARLGQQLARRDRRLGQHRGDHRNAHPDHPEAVAALRGGG